MRYGKWFPVHCCVGCDRQLLSLERMYSGGVCPHCGHITRGTICGTYTKSMRKVDHSPLWKFWENKITYETGSIDKTYKVTVTEVNPK